MNVVGSPFNANGWSKTNFDINIETTDLESGISNYKYCQTTTASCTPSTTVNNASGVVTITTESATNKVCVQAYDNANNSSEVVCTNSYKLDKTAPTAGTISLSGTLGSNGWYTSNVTVNKTDGSDTLSGHATTLSHTSITSETTGITVTLTTTDQAGNTATRTELVKVDKTNPTVPTFMGMTFADGVTNYTNNTWTNNNVYMYGGISGSTDSNGVVKYQISSDNVTWVDYSYLYTNPLYGLTTEGTQYRYARAVDAAGNVSGVLTKTIKIDKTPPTVPTFMGMTFSDGVTNYTNNTWTKNNVYMYGGISGSTDTNGISKYQISSDNVTWVDYSYLSSNPLYGLTTEGTHYRYARAVDVAGNVSGSLTKTIKIDKTIPVITVNPTTVTVYRGSSYTDTGVTASDNISGNITASIVKTGSVNTNVVGSYILTYNVSDAAGNVAATKTRTVNVVEPVYNYSYTGNYQSFTAPCDVFVSGAAVYPAPPTLE
jgi:hypothetical protein